MVLMIQGAGALISGISSFLPKMFPRMEPARFSALEAREDIVFGYGDDSAFLLFGTADVDAVGEVQERMDFLRSDRRIQFDTDAVRTGNSIRGEG